MRRIKRQERQSREVFIYPNLTPLSSPSSLLSGLWRTCGILQEHRSFAVPAWVFDVEKLGESALISSTSISFGTEGGAHHVGDLYVVWCSDMYPEISVFGFPAPRRPHIPIE